MKFKEIGFPPEEARQTARSNIEEAKKGAQTKSRRRKSGQINRTVS